MNLNCSASSHAAGDASPAPSIQPLPEVATLSAIPAEDSKAWDEAFLRVQSYLHAYRLKSALQLTQLATDVITQARSMTADFPGVPPVRLAMQVLQRRMGEWFQTNIEGGSWLDDRFRARGRLSVLLSDIVTVWPEQFLSPQLATTETKAALQISELQPGPEVRLSKMPPAELEFGFGDNDEVPEVSRWAVHPAVGMCVVLVSAMGAAWAATH
jgi:hypothetical protein